MLRSGHDAAAIRFDDELYRDKGFGDSTGFYDWLRSAGGKIIGLRYWPFEDTAFLVDAMRPLQYVTASADRSFVEIYFGELREFDEQMSDDQDFGNAKVFGSDDGSWALTFDVTGLDDLEMEWIHAAVARRRPERVGDADDEQATSTIGVKP